MNVTIDRTGYRKIAIVRIALPSDRAIGTRDAEKLGDAIASVLNDDSINAIVVTGSEGRFIPHADVHQIGRAAAALATGRIAPDSFLDSPFVRLGRLLDEACKPVIAAIDGECLGAGLEIAIACTMRVAGAGVKQIGLPEIRIGLFPGGGGTQRMERLVGWQRARTFMLHGRIVDAQEAVAIGLVDEVAQDPMARALEIAAEIAARSPAAVAALLELTRPRHAPVGFDAEVLAFARLLRDRPETASGLERFLASGARLRDVV